MPKIHFYILIVIALVISACSGNSPDVDPETFYDWCYVIDFETIQNPATSPFTDFDLNTGVWIDGVGYQSSGGVLNFTYTHNQIVEAQYITSDIILYHIDTNLNLSTPLYADVNIFGIATETQGDVLTAVTSQTIQGKNLNAGSASSTASVYIDFGDGIVTISNVTIYGSGYNPFASNSCGGAPTPSRTPAPLPTLTASNTPTPSPTDTPTQTYTPSATNTPAIEEMLHITFSDDDGSWQDYEPVVYYATPFITDIGSPRYDVQRVNRASYPSGWAVSQGVQITFESPVTVSRVAMEHAYFRSSDNGNPAIAYDFYDDMDTIIYSTGNTAFTAGAWRSDDRTLSVSGVYRVRYNLYRGSPVASSDAYTLMDNLKLWYIPDSLLTPTGTPDATGTEEAYQTATQDTANSYATSTQGAIQTATYAAITPSLTLTPTVQEQCTFLNYSFDNGLTDWLGNATSGTGAAYMADDQFVSQSIDLTPGDYILTLIGEIAIGSSSGGGQASFAYEITEPSTTYTFDSFPNIDESYFAQQGNRVAFVESLSIDENGTHDFVFTGLLTDVVSLRLLSACVSEYDPEGEGDSTTPDAGSGWGGDCEAAISPPTSIVEIGGWIVYLWESADQTVQCVIMPPINRFVGGFFALLDWSYLTASGFFEWSTGPLLFYLFGSISNLLNVLLYLIQNGLSGIIYQFNLVTGAINSSMIYITGYVGEARILLDAVNIQIDQLVGMWDNAQPIPPLGLPDCVNDPLEYEICAVYWVAEWTILYGSPGQLIIPSAVLLIDILTFLWFANSAKRFILRIWSVFSD